MPDLLRDPLRDQLQASLGSAYTLERELGGGGMSRVFLARDAALERHVVVKVLSPDLAAGVSAERFTREIKLAAGMQQANIVPLHAAGQTDGLPYYTMPFVDGLSLRARLERNGALPVGEVISVLRDVARALAYAHEHGVVHRDIKPENILLSGAAAMVTDFGIAKALAASRRQAAGATLTQVGTSIGTPAYMAPEQALGDTATDARADLYALGVVAYEALAGSHPFAGRSPQALVAAHATERPEPLALRRPSVPPELAALVMRLLEKHPADRPQSADELLRDLDEVATLTRAPTDRARGRSIGDSARSELAVRRVYVRAASLAVGAALMLALAAGAAWYRRPRASDPGTQRTVAVAPFENLGNAADLYFADGVTEEIASRLARVPGLTVLGRASAVGLRGAGKSPEEIARALGAAYVLRGSVRWARGDGVNGGVSGGTTVRIVPALVNVASGAEVWGEPYQAPLTDVFRVQAEVAERVATALQAKLAADAGQTWAADRVAPAAYDAYLLGRSYWRKRGVENLRRAAAEFRRAIALDSSFARAWAGYADVLSVLPGSGDAELTAGAARREAEPAARRAIALAPADAQGYIALASVLQNDYKFGGALAALDAALARDSTDATAYHRRAEVLLALGRMPEAEAAGQRALALDPLAAIVNHVLATVLLSERRTDEAIRLWRRATALAPDVLTYKRSLSRAYIEAGRPDQADAVAREMGDTSQLTRDIRRGLVDPRYRTEARAALAAWRATAPDAATTPHVQFALYYAYLGVPDSAFAMLRRGAEARHPAVAATLDTRPFDALRTDPRWAEIVRAVRGAGAR